MALQFSPKAPNEIKRYSWAVPVVEDDTLGSFSITSSSGVIVDGSDIKQNDIVLYLSGGTASTVGKIVLHAVTNEGEEFDETFYIPILPDGADVAHSETVQSIIEFALRPVVGLTGEATADELTDGLEWLNGMLSYWRGTGADVGAAFPLALSDNLYAPDEWILAIKNNLRIMIAEQYGRQVAPATAFLASKGLQAIKNDRLGDAEPNRATYF